MAAQITLYDGNTAVEIRIGTAADAEVQAQACPDVCTDKILVFNKMNIMVLKGALGHARMLPSVEFHLKFTSVLSHFITTFVSFLTKLI